MVEGGREGMVEGGREGMVEGGREGIGEGGREGIGEGGREGMVEGGREGMVEGGREGMVEGERELRKGERSGGGEEERGKLERLSEDRRSLGRGVILDACLFVATIPLFHTHCISSTPKVNITKPDKEETTEQTTDETTETPAKKDDVKKTEPKKVSEPEVNSKDSVKENPKTTPLDKAKVGSENN